MEIRTALAVVLIVAQFAIGSVDLTAGQWRTGTLGILFAVSHAVIFWPR